MSELMDSIVCLLDTAREEGFDAGVRSAQVKCHQAIAEARDRAHREDVELGSREHIEGKPLRHPNHEKGDACSAYRDLKRLFDELKATDWRRILVLVVDSYYRKGRVHMSNVISSAADDDLTGVSKPRC